MQMKIAVFGSEEMINRVRECQLDVDNINIVPFVYDYPNEIEQLIMDASTCDVFLFTGPLPYYLAKRSSQELNIPSVYIPVNDLNVSLVLFSIYYHHGIEIERLSIDLPDSKYVRNVLTALQLQPSVLHIQEYRWIIEKNYTKEFHLDEIVSKHIQLWKEKKIDLVLTSIHAVYDQLQKKNIPCMRMIDPKKNIIDSLKEAKVLGELHQSQQSQIAVGLISMNGFETVLASDITSQEHILKTHQLLLQFAKKINCSVQHIGNEQFVLFGTRGSIEHLTEHFLSLQRLIETEEKLARTISIGFGLGMTTAEAEKHAKIALDYAKKTEVNSAAYIVTEEQTVIGPLNDKVKRVQLKVENEQVRELAKKLKISPTNLLKIQQFLDAHSTNRFTSNDVADYLEVSRRSAERLLKKFADQGYLHIIGEEQPHQSGRPRAIYTLNLPDFHKKTD